MTDREKTDQLLFRPELRPAESLRGYICRVTDHNMVPSLGRPMLASLLTATDSIEAVAELTGCDSEALATRLVAVRRSGARAAQVRLGAALLPPRHVWIKQRLVCPRCLAQEAVAPCCWELRSYDVCHRHGCKLARACGACKRRLSWDVSSVDRCICGVELWRTPAPDTSPDRQRLCGLIAAATTRAISACHADDPRAMSSSSQMSLPVARIDLLLLMIEFIGKLVLPAFARVTDQVSMDALHRMRHSLIAQMLEDQPYQDYLRDTLFLHAASDPLTLVEAMVPGKDSSELRRYFGPCLADLSFHRCLWQLSATGETHRIAAPTGMTGRKSDPHALRKLGKQSRQRACDPGGITWRPRSTPAPRNMSYLFSRKKK